jgi:NAD(P)-dependent dehydrogenase (short-subunit alcohol dehydrogenase family)
MTTLTFDLARERGVIGKVGQLKYAIVFCFVSHLRQLNHCSSPLGRFGIAEEIANVALFLASGISHDNFP